MVATVANGPVASSSRREEGTAFMGTSVSFTDAADILAERDPVIARLRAESGPPQLHRFPGTPFAVLVRAIVYQQLAGAAAAAIHGRLVAALDDDVQPEGLAALSDETLRAVGMSRNKVLSLRDLADKVLDGTVVLTPRGLGRQSDEEIVERLSTVRGIGRWTAEMFLLFQLRRLDIWPTGDLAVREGWRLMHGLDVAPTPKQLELAGDPFRPVRSAAAWYCWQAVHVARGQA